MARRVIYVHQISPGLVQFRELLVLERWPKKTEVRAGWKEAVFLVFGRTWTSVAWVMLSLLFFLLLIPTHIQSGIEIRYHPIRRSFPIPLGGCRIHAKPSKTCPRWQVFTYCISYNWEQNETKITQFTHVHEPFLYL